MSDRKASWRWKNGLVTWAYSIPARSGEDVSTCLERVVTGVIGSTDPFAQTAHVVVTTEDRGEDAFQIDGATRNPSAVVAA